MARKYKHFQVIYEKQPGEPVVSVNTSSIDFARSRLNELIAADKLNPIIVCETYNSKNQYVRLKVNPDDDIENL